MDFSDLLKREYALFEDLIVQKEIDWNENISPALQIVVDKMLIQKQLTILFLMPSCILREAVQSIWTHFLKMDR